MQKAKGIKIKTLIAVVLLWSVMLPLAGVCMAISFEQVRVTPIHAADPLAAIGCVLVAAVLLCGSILLTTKLIRDDK